MFSFLLSFSIIFIFVPGEIALALAGPRVEAKSVSLSYERTGAVIILF